LSRGVSGAVSIILDARQQAFSIRVSGSNKAGLSSGNIVF